MEITKMRRLLLVVGMSLWLPAAALAAGFRAAVVKIDITPSTPQFLLGYAERKSTGVHDRIFHRILALDDGQSQFFFVSSELCLVSPAEYDKVAAALEKSAGIPRSQWWWTVTHTHAAPEVGPPGLPAAFMGERYHHEVDAVYTELVEKRLVEGILEARKNLEPASLGAGWGLSMANMNRRGRDVSGEAFLGMNPDGAMDRRIGLLRIDKADGKPLALVANYPIHGTVLSGANTEISGDAPGVVSEYLEQKIGVPALFINGAAGNLAPIYSVYADFKSGHLSQFRVLLGDKILEAYARITATTPNVRLAAGAVTVETPRKPGLKWPADLGDYTRTTSTGEQVVRLPVRFLKINEDIAIWSAPLELFCEVAMEIRHRSPFPHTFYFGYANGWLGYLVTPEEMKYGGYEPRVSPYTTQGAGDLVRAVVSYLQGARH